MDKVADNQVRLCLQKIKSDDDSYFIQVKLIWDGLDNTLRESLKQLLFQGPVWDGNVISKSARDKLIQYELATRCCFMGEQGYTASTYLGYSVFKEGKGDPIAKKPGSPG